MTVRLTRIALVAIVVLGVAACGTEGASTIGKDAGAAAAGGPNSGPGSSAAANPVSGQPPTGAGAGSPVPVAPGAPPAAVPEPPAQAGLWATVVVSACTPGGPLISCPMQQVAATINVLDAGGTVIAQGRSSAHAPVFIAAAPGRWTLHTSVPGKNCLDVTVTVVAGHASPVQLGCQ